MEDTLDLIDTATDVAPAATRAIATARSATPADLLRIAVENGADLDKLERLMALQERYEANNARKAYDAAFAAFKAEAVAIIKNKNVTDGPLKNKKYADLFAVTNAVTPALSKHGLSSSWKVTRDESQWIEVTCYLRHVDGHIESVSMGGPPDTGGAKNALQARASTKSYLERYTLTAATGLAAQEQDDDGNGGATEGDWVARAIDASTLDDLETIRKDGAAAYTKARDVPGYTAFMRAVGERSKALKAAK